MNNKALVAYLLLFSGATGAGERLEGDDLMAFWNNQTIVGVHVRHGPTKTFHHPDGYVHSKTESGAERVGKWWINKDKVRKCTRWDHQGKNKCHFVERNSDGTHSLVHGKKGYVVVVIEARLEGNQL